MKRALKKIVATISIICFTMSIIFVGQNILKTKDFSKNTTNENESNNDSVVIDSKNHGIGLLSERIPIGEYENYGIDAMAETAYMLTATIKPDNATNKEVDWSVEFKNPSSEWAIGKDVASYVKITPTSSGALTANVACLQAFGEQIIVKVISREISSINATCTLDYVKRITDATFSWSAMNGVANDSIFVLGNSAKLKTFRVMASAMNNEKKILSVTTTEGVGTISDSFTYTAVMEWNSTYKPYAETALGATLPNGSYDLAPGFTPSAEFLATFFGGDTISSNYGKFYTLLSQYSSINFFTVKVTMVGSVVSWNQTYNIGLDKSTLGVSVTSLEMDDSSILF